MQNQAGHKNITINLIKELVEQYDVEGDGKLNIKGNVGRGGMVYGGMVTFTRIVVMPLPFVPFCTEMFLRSIKREFLF